MEDNLVIPSGEHGREARKTGRQWEVQMTEPKKGYKDILYNPGYIASVL